MERTPGCRSVTARRLATFMASPRPWPRCSRMTRVSCCQDHAGAPSGIDHLGVPDEAAGRVVARRRRHLGPVLRGEAGFEGTHPAPRPRSPRRAPAPPGARRWTCGAPARSDRPGTRRASGRRTSATSSRRARSSGGRAGRRRARARAARPTVAAPSATRRRTRDGARTVPPCPRTRPRWESRPCRTARCDPPPGPALRRPRPGPCPPRAAGARAGRGRRCAPRGGSPGGTARGRRCRRPGLRAGRRGSGAPRAPVRRAPGPGAPSRCQPGPSGQRSKSVARRTANHSSKAPAVAAIDRDDVEPRWLTAASARTCRRPPSRSPAGR